MKEEKDYIQDITEIRNMMERSSKFLSLSGLSGVMAGIYALVGAYIAHQVFHFNPKTLLVSNSPLDFDKLNIIGLASVIMILAIGTAIFLSFKNADKREEKLWNSTAKRMVLSMVVPLLVGGILLLFCIANGIIGLLIPFTLIFYGLALYNASKYTFNDVQNLGLIQIALGLLSTFFIEYSLLFWAIGFGIMHIVYGIYLYYKYEK